MRVFVAGGTGAVGRPLVLMLVASGHQVTAMSRSPTKVAALRKCGADGVVADGLDREALRRAVAAARPDIVIHQMTRLAEARSLRNFDVEFAVTNRLRTEGTDYLIAAARAAGIRRIIVQSYGNWNYERAGAESKSESAPFDPSPPANQRNSLQAIRYCEAAVAAAQDIEGIALRYGNFYGPGTGFSLDGDIANLIRKRQLPIIGTGAGIWCFVHVDDAAAATIAAMTRGSPGVYNICDDDPAPVSTWLPELARILSAKPPRRLPSWLGRLAVGEVGVSMMTRIRGASNDAAKRELDWRLRYTSWREGFRSGLGEISISSAMNASSACASKEHDNGLG